MTPDKIFPLLNGVIIGWGCLLFLPKWRHTPAITLLISQLYAVAYGAMLLHRITLNPEPLPLGGGFETLDAVSILFSDRASLLAGWTHYISFDLFIARYCVLDSQERGIPHYLVVPIIPTILMIGPAGFAIYTCLVVPLHSALTNNKPKNE